jgi:hypothetical protein
MVYLDEANPTLSGLLRAAAEDVVGNTHGPIPAIVTEFSGSTQRCSAQPVIALPNYRTGTFKPFPIIPNIPVAYPNWNGGCIYWPLTVGSVIQLVPQDYDISTWLSTSTANQPPPTPTSCDWASIVAIPGPMPTALTDIGDGLSPVISAAKLYLGSGSATDYVALASVVMQGLNMIKTSYNAHKHIETGGTTGVPDVQIGAITDVKSTRVLAI